MLFPLALSLATPTRMNDRFPLGNTLGLFVSILPYNW